VPELQKAGEAPKGEAMSAYLNTAPPHTIVEVAAASGVLRAWRPIYNFDTTDGGRLEPLTDFLFELKEESSGTRTRSPRPYRLYLDGFPCLGAQWQYDIDGAIHSIEHVVGSYAHHRRSSVYAAQQPRTMPRSARNREVAPGGSYEGSSRFRGER
jgi:hypothetical protein